MKKMSEIDKDLRPREKLQRRGAAALSDHELIMAIIGSGNSRASVADIARQIVKLLKNCDNELTYDDLMKIPGMGSAKAVQMMASYELWRRRLEKPDRPILANLADAAKQFDDIRHKNQEHVMVLSIDGAGRLINKRVVSVGTVNSSLIHPREVYADVIVDRASAVVIGHNHPGGTMEPSDEDVAVTRRLKNAAELLGIIFWDHLVITDDDYLSILASNKYLRG